MTEYVKTPRLKVKEKPNPNVTWNFFDSHLLERIQQKEIEVDPKTGWEYGQYRFKAGEFEFLLARKFGFCYGVKLAIWDSLSALDKYRGKRIVALSEMIHNPYVNDELRRRGTIFMDEAQLDFDAILPDDVVIIPAFGTTTLNFERLAELSARGCTLIDTTCRSVIDVWDRVKEYNEISFTCLIHGKYEHEETIATASVARHYLIVRDMAETEQICQFIRGELTEEDILERFAKAVSPGFSPVRDLKRIGMANQTTMRSSESEEVFGQLREAVVSAHGEEQVDAHFKALDTICRATEVRQQAVIEMCGSTKLELMLVVGGLNSSNTKNLAKIACNYTTAYHIEGAWSFSGGEIRHLVYGDSELTVSDDWLPSSGRIGITAGASTPDNTVSDVLDKILQLRPQ